MSFKKLLIASAAVLLLAGCTNSNSVTVITPQGVTLKGITTVTTNAFTFDRSFQITGGGLNCSGTANSKAIPDNVPISCSDGRKGVAVFNGADANSDTGADHGTITLQDGSTAQFVTGDAARAF